MDLADAAHRLQKQAEHGSRGDAVHVIVGDDADLLARHDGGGQPVRALLHVAQR
jgi:hypothetical protein